MARLLIMTRPTDSLELLSWINERQLALNRLRRHALFNARLQGRFEQAVQISGLSRKKALAETRAENSARGKMVRWASR